MTTAPFLAQAAAPSGGNPIVLMVAILAIIYFLVIRPQKKEQDAHKALLDSLKKGDRVVTRGGQWGTVFEVRDAEVVLEVADKVHVTFDKIAVLRRPADQAETAKESA